MATTETEFRSRSISEKVVTEFHFFHTSPAILNMEWLFVWPLYYVCHLTSSSAVFQNCCFCKTQTGKSKDL